MKNTIILGIFLLASSLAFSNSEIINRQVSHPLEIELTDAWIQDHFKAVIIGNQIEVLTKEMAFEDANVTLVNILTGFEYSFNKFESNSRLNISNVPKGTYYLKISEDLLYESITKLEIG